MPKPRKSGPRTPSGRPSRAYKGACRDAGTKELQAKKLAVVNGAADPSLSATAASILFAHRVLDRDQLAAAHRYAALHAIVFGQAWGGACILGREPGEDTAFDDDQLERRERELDQMHARMTPAQRKAVADVACFNAVPNWFYAERLRLRVLPEDRRDRRALLSGLDKLVGR